MFGGVTCARSADLTWSANPGGQWWLPRDRGALWITVDVCHGPHHPADLTEREAATPWAAGHPDTHHRQRAIPQRSQLAPHPLRPSGWVGSRWPMGGNCDACYFAVGIIDRSGDSYRCRNGASSNAPSRFHSSGRRLKPGPLSGVGLRPLQRSVQVWRGLKTGEHFNLAGETLDAHIEA